MGLVEEITAARLPEPTRRRMIRLAAGASFADLRAELQRRGVDVSHVSIMRWENGDVVPRRDRAIVYRQLLEDLEAATR